MSLELTKHFDGQQLKNNEDIICGLLKQTNRHDVDRLIEYMKESGFFVDPASTKYHSNFVGGLAEHTKHVFYCLDSIISCIVTSHPPEKSYFKISRESVIIAAICHDLCKIGCYKLSVRNRKVLNQWEQYEVWEYQQNENNLPLGHGNTSIEIAERFITLEPIEKIMIANHMGFVNESWERQNEIGFAYTKYPAAAALHIADLQATFLYEETIKV